VTDPSKQYCSSPSCIKLFFEFLTFFEKRNLLVCEKDNDLESIFWYSSEVNLVAVSMLYLFIALATFCEEWVMIVCACYISFNQVSPLEGLI